MVFAGQYAARGGLDDDAPAAAVARDGPPATAREAGLALAWSGPATWDPDGRVACLVDGRPGTARLAAELRLDPATPAAALVASGYALLGDAVVERLDGAFALVVWDRAGRRGLLARDRLGQRPLFVAEHGAVLAFASEVRNLLGLLPARPAPDELALAAWLARAPAPGARTLFTGIRALPGGHAVRLAGGRGERFRFWRPSYHEPRVVGAGEAAAAVRDGLRRATARAVETADRPGVLLSGGLDSATVAAMVRERRPTAYSAVFPGRREVDESVQIRRVRESLGLEGVEAEPAGGSALRGATEFVREWELPPVSPNRFVWAPLLRRAASDGVDVLLDGEGGDELFGCARYLIADDLLAGRPLRAVRDARRLPGMGDRPRPRWIARALLTYGVRAALPAGVHERLRSARGRSRGPAWLEPEVPDARWAWKRGDGPRWWRQLAHELTDDPIGATDELRREVTMHGMEARHPLRDPELVDLVLALPPQLAFDPHVDRPLARRAVAGLLPPEVLAATGKPVFNVLLEEALAGSDREPLARLLGSPHAALASQLAPGAALPVTPPTGHPPAWALDAWRLASLQIWLLHQGGDERLARFEEALEPAASVRFAGFEQARPSAR